MLFALLNIKTIMLTKKGGDFTSIHLIYFVVVYYIKRIKEAKNVNKIN